MGIAYAAVQVTDLVLCGEGFREKQGREREEEEEEEKGGMELGYAADIWERMEV